MKTPASRPKVIDLFAGVGGLSLGFEQAGYDVAAAVEFDPVHMATHEYNFPETASFARDVKTLSGEEILAGTGLKEEDVHAVVGGAPCQGFSMIGKRTLDDPRNQLVNEFARIVLEIQPRYFVLENVAGLVTGKHRKFLDEVIELFESNEYQVLTPVRVLQAAEFGVPQSRKRLFLIGARKDVPPPVYPEPTHFARKINGQEVSGTLPLSPSVREAIADIPDADQFPDLLTADVTSATYGEPSLYAAILRGEAPVDRFGHVRLHDPSLLTSSRRTNHTQKSIDRFKATPPGTTEKIGRFLRLHPDGISNTLRAGTASDRGAHTSPRPLHPKYPRVITVREAARLHGYPDWFRFHSTKWHGFRQIGNSVPPRLGQAVATSLLDADGISPSGGRLIDVDRDPAPLYFKSRQAESFFGITERVIPQRNRRNGSVQEAG